MDIARHQLELCIRESRPGSVVDGYPTTQIQTGIIFIGDSDILGMPLDAGSEISDFGVMCAGINGIQFPDQGNLLYCVL